MHSTVFDESCTKKGIRNGTETNTMYSEIRRLDFVHIISKDSHCLLVSALTNFATRSSLRAIVATSSQGIGGMEIKENEKGGG